EKDEIEKDRSYSYVSCCFGFVTLVVHLGSRLLVHVSRERLDVLEWCRRQDAVAQVEDVAGTTARAVQDIVGRGNHAIERPEQQRRIQIALNAAIGPDAFPRLVERRSPIRADHIPTGLTQQIQN